MGSMKSQVTYSVQEKKERLYAVIQYKLDGRRETKWRVLGLPVGAQKSKITKASREVVNRFEAELAEEIERNARPPTSLCSSIGLVAERRQTEHPTQHL